VETLSSFSKEELIALILQLRSIIEEQAEALKRLKKRLPTSKRRSHASKMGAR